MAKEKKAPTGGRGKRRGGPAWDAGQVRALRQHLGLSQQSLADELGTRQQTVSEWETGQYQPRGASATLLNIVAERAGFRYGKAEADEWLQAQQAEGEDRRKAGRTAEKKGA